MDAETRSEIARMQHRTIDEISRLTRNIPIRWERPDSLPSFVKIIGGQLVNGINGITYAADPFSADQAYNPDTATSYIVGLGYGMLYNSAGQAQQQVIVRDNYSAFTGFKIAGTVWSVGPPLPIPIAGSSPAASILAYSIIYG